jgi:hypothetical protein
VTTFFRDLGYELPGNQLFGDLPVLVQTANALIAAVEDLAAASSDDARLQALAKLLEAIARMASEIHGAITAIKASVNAIPGFIANSDIDELPLRLVDYLLSLYLSRSQRRIYGVLLFIGVLDEIDMPADSAKFQPAFKLRKVWWDRLPKLVSEPQNLPEIVYQWETAFDAELFLSRLYILFNAFNLPGGLYTQSASVKSALQNTTDGLQELRMPIFERAVWPSTHSQFGINVSPVEQLAADKPGFAIIPYIFGDTSFDFDISENFEIRFSASASVDAGIGLVFRPNTGVRFLNNLFSSPGDSIDVGLLLEANQKAGSDEIILIGSPGATRLAIQGLQGKVFVSKSGDTDAGFELSLDALRLVIAGSDGDGFISKILGDGGITAEVGLGLGISKKGGFYFTGSGGLEIQLPTHIELGPLEILGLVVALKLREGNLVLESGANLKVALGPVAGAVENVGITATLAFPDDGGNLGPVDLTFGFKPPNGVGLSIDAGVIKGGGYLFIDADRGEYAGALELTFSEFLSLKAIGLISTKNPDGSPGFSLLIIITAEFGAGFQLGYGFTLLAVGGLLGLNRTMKLQALVEGIRTGAVESIMFPQDVVANAPKIISDLRAIFPPQEGIFLIGPMAKIGWGTPTLISISMGIIIEIPGNIAILGILKIALPAEEIPLIIIQVNFAGVIEFDRKRIYFFAALFESRIVFLTIEGEMGLLMAFGDDANFVATVGGFHPRFSPPPLPFPSPRRIAVSLLNTPVSRIRIEGYFAVTSNTAQFGARVEVFFGLDEINVQGHLAFDALFQFSPFYFIFEISASLSVKVFGIGLFSVRVRGSLDGPAPYHVKGHGSISLLFWDIDVDFEDTWGESRNTELPPLAVMPMLEGEINKADNWRALLPASSNLLVSLRKMSAEESALILHPVGVLHISQRALPLELKLDKVGTQKPSDVNRLSIVVSGGGLVKTKDAAEQFAPAQFQNFSDSNKLSRPAFAPEKSGLDLSAADAAFRSSVMVKRIVRYEEIIIDNNFKRFQQRFRGYLGTLFNFFLAGNAAARCQLSFSTKAQLQPFQEKIEIKTETYTVAFQANNRAYAADSVSFHSEASARDYLDRKLTEDASLTDELHVIPGFERAA